MKSDASKMTVFIEEKVTFFKIMDVVTSPLPVLNTLRIMEGSLIECLLFH